MITYYARPVGRGRQNVFVENGVVVRHYVADMLGFTYKGDSALLGQLETSLPALGFEQVPGPLKMSWGLWESLTPDELRQDEEKWRHFFEKSAREALSVSGTTIEISVPRFYPTLGEKDWFTVEQWHVAVGDIVQASNPLVSIECAIGFFTVLTPSKELCRVERILVSAGASVQLGELIMVLGVSQRSE